jgi:hypothetical protein
VRLPVVSPDPARSLARITAALGVSGSPLAPQVPPEALYATERGLVDGFWVIPLFHLPEIYGSSARVRTWATPGLSRLGAWHFEDLWIDEAKP